MSHNRAYLRTRVSPRTRTFVGTCNLRRLREHTRPAVAISALGIGVSRRRGTTRSPEPQRLRTACRVEAHWALARSFRRMPRVLLLVAAAACAFAARDPITGAKPKREPREVDPAAARGGPRQGKAHQALKDIKEELLDGKGENATCIARGPGESMCQAIRGYMAENGYTRLFVLAPAKCASTTIDRFFGFSVRRDWNASFCPNQWAIGGRRLWRPSWGHASPFSLEFTRAACSGTTLFIFTVRGKLSWFESALRHVCVRWAHCARENITKVVRRRMHEFGGGPVIG